MDLLSVLGLKVYVPFPGHLLLATWWLGAFFGAASESCVPLEVEDEFRIIE